MSQFDPYVEWLGIRDEVRPPYHYRLLAIELLESDADIIANAADRQMTFIRTFQSGGRVQESQRLLSEIAAAKSCLLDPTRKEEYDAWLREHIRNRQQASTASASGAALPAQAKPKAPEAETAPVLSVASGPSASISSKYRKKKTSPVVPIVFGLLGLLMVGAVVLVAMNMGEDPPPRPDIVVRDDPKPQPKIRRPTVVTPKPKEPTPPPVVPEPDASKAWEIAPTELERNAVNSFNRRHEYELSHGVNELLKQARTQFSERQLDEALATLEKAKLGVVTADDRAEIDRLEQMHEWLTEFWAEVDSQLAEIKVGDKLTFATAKAQLVSIDDEQFVLADGDAQQSFSRDHIQMPANVAVALVAVGPYQVVDEVRIATFWALDRAGNPSRARFAANQAGKQGFSVDPILREIALGASEISIVGGPRIDLDTDDPTQPPIARQPVPSDESQAAAMAKLKELFAAQFSIADTPDGASHLIKSLSVRLEQPLDTAMRYTMLFEIQKLAIGTADATAFCDATDRMARHYEIDKPRFLAAGMARIGQTLKNDKQRQAYFEAGLRTVTELAEADQYEAAEGVLRELLVLARTLDTVTADQRKELVRKRKDVIEAKSIFAHYVKAKEALAAEPEDPVTNHLVGKYLAWQKEQWKEGLPYLAKSDDPKIKTAATIELTAPQGAVEKNSLANLWWDISETTDESDDIAVAIKRHSATWYQSALVGLSGDEARAATARILTARQETESQNAGPTLYRYMIDDEMVGFNMTMPWSSTNTTGFQGGVRYARPGNGRYQALWVFSNVPRGKYRIYATWPTHEWLRTPRASNAVYELKDGRKQIATETVTHALPSRGDLVTKGHNFQLLGEINAKSGVIKVLLTDVANGYVLADAVAIVQVE